MGSFLKALVWLFPAPFRERFGAEMEAQVEEDYRRARTRGRIAAVAFVVATGLDLARSAAAERVDPSWTMGLVAEGKRMRRGRTIDEWTRDLRQAARALRRAPGFTVVSVVTLALALGAVAGIFSVVDSVLLRPLPFPHADRLVYLAGTAPGSDLPDEFGLGAEFYLQYREESELLEEVAVYNDFTATLRAGDRVERVRMSAPTTSLFETLGVQPILGRLPTPEDESDVIVISHALWASWFGSDPGVLGRSYEVAGAGRTVVGVMGPEFRFPRDGVLLWIPVVVRAEQVVPGRFGPSLVARVAQGVERETLVAELSRLAARLPERFGGSPAYARMIERHRPVVRPLREQMLGVVSRPLWILLGSAGIVLLIACANVGNLFMVRAERRQLDLAVRRAMGAGRGRLVRSQLAEAVWVGVLAAPLAVLLAWLSIPLFLRAAPPDIPRLADVGLTPTTLLFTIASCALAVLLCGMGPAVRSSAARLTGLRDGGRGTTRRRRWGRDGLVVGQTALALVLLIGSGLLVRSFQELRRVDPGYDTEDLFSFQIAPEGEHLQDGADFARFHTDFADRLRALPGVRSVGLVENLPLNEGLAQARFFPGEGGSDPDGGSLLSFTWADGSYFGTMGIDLLRGRTFTRSDEGSNPVNVVVSRSAAELLWPGEDPIGRRFRRAELDVTAMVVGVVEDVMQYGFRDTPQAQVYYPLVGPEPTSWTLSSPAYVVKTPRADVIAPEIRALVAEVAPEAPMYRTFTMEGLAADSMVHLSFTMLTLGIASALALVLGALGLYGVLSYLVAERTREIGVRMALGAEARRVRRMVVVQGARVVLVGVAVGAVVALAATRALGTLLFGVEAVDPGTFAGMSLSMIAVGLLASYLPARRASSVDPIQCLRGE